MTLNTLNTWKQFNYSFIIYTKTRSSRVFAYLLNVNFFCHGMARTIAWIVITLLVQMFVQNKIVILFWNNKFYPTWQPAENIHVFKSDIITSIYISWQHSKVLRENFNKIKKTKEIILCASLYTCYKFSDSILDH